MLKIMILLFQILQVEKVSFKIIFLFLIIYYISIWYVKKIDNIWVVEKEKDVNVK